MKADSLLELPPLRVDVVEAGERGRPERVCCMIGTHLQLSVNSLKAYCVSNWQPIVYDALLLAAAVEFCDRTKKRPALGWGRHIELRLPVHDVARWSAPDVGACLRDALSFLTGDRWQITFVSRKQPVQPPYQRVLPITPQDFSVIPFSDGMDSRAVASLEQQRIGDKLIRVRVGPKRRDHILQIKNFRRRQPFTAIPYRVSPAARDFAESSGRSRGFKFFMASGLAAYLLGASRVIVPESGQGALGPWLIPVGHAPEDCRNHPLFARRMEAFLYALLNHTVRYEFPRLWHTKGETLAEYVSALGEGAAWQSTWSCWQQGRQVSVKGEKRQCGICAACMLRRVSVHAAGLAEPAETYVWENLGASTFGSGVAAGFTKATRKQREYAIAGALHLDHLAALQNSRAGQRILQLRVAQLSEALKEPEADVQRKLLRLLKQHKLEWEAFMDDVGRGSFLADWLPSVQ